MASLLWIEIRIYGYFNLFWHNKMRILLKNTVRIQKIQNWPCFPHQWLLPSSGETASKSYNLNWKNKQEHCARSSVWYFNPILALIWVMERKKSFILGNCHRTWSNQKKEPGKLHEVKNPNFSSGISLGAHQRFPHWSQEIMFLSRTSCIRAHCSNSGVNYRLFDVLLPCEEPCIHHCLMQNSII